MSDAHKYLTGIARAMYLQAVDAHAKGCSLVKRSANIEQLARMCSIENAEMLLKLLVREGVVEKSADGYTVLEKSNAATSIDEHIATTCKGGST